MSEVVAIKELVGKTELKSIEMRMILLEMIQHAESGHLGSSLSCLDIISVLKFGCMNWNVEISRTESDVFVLSKGHAVPAWYSALIASGDVDEKYKYELRKIDSPFQGHPDTNRCKWVDVSTGALAQGLSMALGRAYAKKIKKQESFVYCIIGDGECQEGQTWEAFLHAGFRKISNVIVYLDYNKTQNDGKVESILSLEPLNDKLSAFNWHVQEIDGHSHQEIHDATIKAKAVDDKPSIIISYTKKGYIGKDRILLNGAHSGTLSSTEYEEAMNFLKGVK